MANETTGATPGPQGGNAAPKAAAAGGQYAPDELTGSKAAAGKAGADVNLDLVLDVPVNVSLRVGATDMSIRDLVKLVEGSVIALDRQADEAMDVLVNGTLIAHGEIVVVDDRFGVRLTDVVSPVERIQKIN
jgi:flagellar motor switch protein FliN/FliY